MGHPAFDLSGRVALVTGGNGGIGLGFARGLARAGASLAIWGTSAAKNASAAEELRSLGARVETALCDVGDPDDVTRALAATLDAFGRVDACYANAGVGGAAASFDGMTDEEWRRVLRVNLDGVFYTFRAVVGHMLARGGGGTLVGTASTASIMGAARAEHYGASKGAVVSMMRGLAVEYARHGITAHSVLPGWVESEMTARSFANEKFARNVLPRIPMRRWGVAADFEGIAVYLMSDAARWHTGDSLVIDGGYTIF